MAVICCAACLACSSSRAPVPPDVIPGGKPLTAEDTDFARGILSSVAKQHPLDVNDPRLHEMENIVEGLVKAAKADQYPWAVYLLQAPEQVKVRAVRGNHIFIWSGFLDAIQAEEERAAVLAEELAHVLARHTDPIAYSAASNLLLETLSVATAIGIAQISSGTVSVQADPRAIRAAIESLTGNDSIDRDYDDQAEREAFRISLLMLEQSSYNIDGAVSLWARAKQDPMFAEQIELLSKDLTPTERLKLIRELTQPALKPNKPV